MNVAATHEPKKFLSPNPSNGVEIKSVDRSSMPLAQPQLKEHHPLSVDETHTDLEHRGILTFVDKLNANELTEVECLEWLFFLSSRRQDSRRLAEIAIGTYGSLARVFQRPGRELRELIGIDESITALLAITKSSMKFILAPNLPDRIELCSYTDLMNYAALDLREADQEILRVIYLDKKSRVIKDEEMARGTVDKVSIYPKEIAKRAMSNCASFIVLAHNHLGDDPTPSKDDIIATNRTKDALEYLDIMLHDHVIVARNRCFSMQENGLI
jgi:DNA repair protein RadC